MSPTNAAPWLDGLDGTSTWNTKPSALPSTRPTSVTHNATQLVDGSTKIQRRSLSGDSMQSMRKIRSPLAPLPMNEHTMTRRGIDTEDHDKHDGTVQLRSKSSSPAKKIASLEWRKRLLHGKVAYGDQTDLFGPSGLENIFASGDVQTADARRDRSVKWMQKSDATMPSSPPPWPSRLSNHRVKSSQPSSHNASFELQGSSPKSSLNSDPFDLEVTDTEKVEQNIPQEPGTIVNQTLGAVTEMEQEGFSPVYISKHTTINGKVDYATIGSGELQAMQNVEEIDDVAKDQSLAMHEGQEESIFTDGPESKLLPAVHDLSLSENLPTGTPEPLGRFVEVQRGGYSAIGSFRHRPLSMEPSAISELIQPYTDETMPPAPSPPMASSSSHATTKSKQDPISTPLKLFTTHDTFTSNRLMHRLSEVDDISHEAQIRRPRTPLARRNNSAQQRQVSFGDGKLDATHFEPVQYSSSPASDVQVPGSKIPHTFRREDSLNRSTNIGQIGKRMRESQDSQFVITETTRKQSEHKRPPVSPLKHNTPKRRRTLHASELLEGNIQQTLQTNDEKAQTTLIDASLREATDDFLAHENPSIVEDVLEQVEQSLSDTDAATLRERAEVIAGEVAKFTLRVQTADMHSTDGVRKPSVTTQDFFREAECVMEYIRARASKQKTVLASVEETQQEDDQEDDQSLLIPKGSARLDTNLRVSREPSWEDRPRSRWREPEQQRVQKEATNLNRVASQLRRWKEPDVLEEQDIFAEHSLPSEYHLESEMVYDEDARIRITGPSSERAQESDSRPQSQRSAQSSNETTRRTENVGTLAPNAVAHLIGSEVGGMTFDKDKQRWIRTRSPEHKVDNGFLNIHESHLTSEDDPFREISDLVVDEPVERRRISSPARLNEKLDMPVQPKLLPIPTLSIRPASFHVLDVPGRTISTSETESLPLTRELANSTTNSVCHKLQQTSIASDERVTRIMNDAEAAVEAEKIYVSEQRAQHGTTTSAPEADMFSHSEDPVSSLKVDPRQFLQSALPLPPRNKPSICDNAPLLPQPAHYHSMLEQSEVSFVAPLPGDRMISVSLSVSKPASIKQDGQVVAVESSPLRHMSTMLLSDLPDFTVHDSDAERPSERMMAQRFARYALTEVNDRYALATKELTRAITNVQQGEVYWDELRKLDLQSQSLETLHGLDRYCDALRELDVSSNKLPHLDGIPSTVMQLSAADNQLTDLTNFQPLHNLQYADLSRNKLEDLSSLAQSIHLRDLRLNDNHIQQIDTLRETSLQKLQCRRNKLEHVKIKPGDFEQLIELDLASNNITSIDGLEHLPSLTTLVLDNNPLLGMNIQQMTGIKVLSLRGCGLSHLDVSYMTSLEVLIVDDNNLSNIVGLDSLAKLKLLSIRRQRLAGGITVSIFDKPLEAHTVLLSGNVLPALSLSQAFLSIRHLELSAVGLNELPAGMGLAMSNLRTLNLNYNNIKDIRPLLHMDSLRSLQVANNQLGRLRRNAAVLAHLPALTQLDLRNNPVTQSFYNCMDINTHTSTIVRYDSRSSEEFKEDIDAARYTLQPLDVEGDTKHTQRLDEDTTLRRRVYEMLLAHSCKRVATLDGLAFAKKDILRKDHIWDKLLNLGVVRRTKTPVP